MHQVVFVRVRKGSSYEETTAIAVENALMAFKTLGRQIAHVGPCNQDDLDSIAQVVGFESFYHVTCKLSDPSLADARDAAHELHRRICLLRLPGEEPKWFDFTLSSDMKSYRVTTQWTGYDSDGLELRVASPVDGPKTCRTVRDLLGENLFVLESDYEVCCWMILWRGRALVREAPARQFFIGAFLPTLSCDPC